MFSLFTLTLVASLSGMYTPPVSASPPAVVVLSFDGFKPDYLKKNLMPKLFSLKNEETGPKYMRSVFPTKTFVTHFTLSTGVYPNVHGVYANQMFNEKGEILFNTKDQFQSNKEIVPIWTENQKVGNGRNSGVMMWPGSEYDYNGIAPRYVQVFDTDLNWEDRVKTIVEWMSNEEDRANFVMAYFEDTTALDDIMELKELMPYIKKVDNTIYEIYTQLKNANIQGNLEMVILSDHGTHLVSGTNVLIIEKYIAGFNVKTIVSGPLVFIRTTNENDFNKLYDYLSGLPNHGTQFHVYSQEKLPDEFKLEKIASLEPVLILVASVGFTFFEQNEFTEARGNKTLEKFKVHENGYDHREPSMNAFFLGIGEKFKDNFFPKDNSFDIVDVYPLLKTLLGLKTPASSVQTDITLDPKVKELLEPNAY